MSEQARTDRPTRNAPARRRREWGWWLAALALLVTVGGIGCNPIQMANFMLMPFASTNCPPNCPLDVPGKESKVVLIVKHENGDLDLTFKDAPDVIARRLVTLLEQRYPQWPGLNLTCELREGIVKHETEYDVSDAREYDADKRGHLYHGNVEIHIAVTDINEDGGGLKYDDMYTCTYPRRGPEDASSMSPAMFRLRFLDRVAKDLVPYFAACPSKDKLDSD